MSLTAEAESRRPTHRYAFVNEAGEGTPTPARPEPARGVPSESALSGARLFDQHRDGGPAAVSGAAGGAIGGGRAGRDDPAAAACVPPPALSVLSQLPRAASGVDALDDIVEMRAQMARLHAALDQTLSQQRLLRAAPAPDSASRAAAASGGWAGGVGGGFEGAPATPTPHSNGVGGHFPGPASSPSASQAGAGVWSGVGVGEAFGADGAGAFARALSALAAAHQQQQQHVGSQLYQGDASAPPPYPASHALCSAHQAPASSAAAASASASAAGAALASAASEGVEAVVAVSVAPPPPLILLHDDVDVDVAAVRGSVAKGPLAASPASPPLNPDSPISKALIRVGALWRFLRRLTSRVVSLLAGPQAAEKLEQGDPRVVFRLGVVVLALLSAVSYATGKGLRKLTAVVAVALPLYQTLKLLRAAAPAPFPVSSPALVPAGPPSPASLDSGLARHLLAYWAAIAGLSAAEELCPWATTSLPGYLQAKLALVVWLGYPPWFAAAPAWLRGVAPVWRRCEGDVDGYVAWAGAETCELGRDLFAILQGKGLFGAGAAPGPAAGAAVPAGLMGLFEPNLPGSFPLPPLSAFSSASVPASAAAAPVEGAAAPAPAPAAAKRGGFWALWGS